jgi:hypothetical protein
VANTKAASQPVATAPSAPGQPIVIACTHPRPMGSQPSAYVRVQVDIVTGWILRVDGQEIGTAPLADLLIEPGAHVFSAEMPDGLLIQQLIDVGPNTGTVIF